MLVGKSLPERVEHHRPSRRLQAELNTAGFFFLAHRPPQKKSLRREKGRPEIPCSSRGLNSHVVSRSNLRRMRLTGKKRAATALPECTEVWHTHQPTQHAGSCLAGQPRTCRAPAESPRAQGWAGRSWACPGAAAELWVLPREPQRSARLCPRQAAKGISFPPFLQSAICSAKPTALNPNERACNFWFYRGFPCTLLQSN